METALARRQGEVGGETVSRACTGRVQGKKLTAADEVRSERAPASQSLVSTAA